MVQTEYAESFIQAMLGWIRSLAGGVASLFQSSGGGHTSSGTALINWFADNWLGLLIALIVLGVLIDWVVWMLRWRPYYLWFHKKRILLDDDIDRELKDEELMRRYANHGVSAPHFVSGARPRDDEDDADEAEYEADYEADYEPVDYDFSDDSELPDYLREDEADGEFEDYVDAPDEYEDEIGGSIFDDEGEYTQRYTPVRAAARMEEPRDEMQEEPDLSEPKAEDPKTARKRENARFAALKAIARKKNEEDPFEVNEADFADLDDDFMELVAREDAPEREAEADLLPADTYVPRRRERKQQ